MRKLTALLVLALLALMLPLEATVGAATVPVTLYLGDVELASGGTFVWFPQIWDLGACAVTVSYTLDLSGAPNVAYTSNYGNSGYVGLVWPGSPWAGAWMSGFLVDWQNADKEFPTYPDFDATQDMDDKFNMARSPGPGYYDERHYNVDCGSKQVLAEVGTPDAWSNYGIWYDRDGVDPWQANMWGMVDGGTYNTNGIYHVHLEYETASNYPDSKGTACAVFFPELQNDDAPGGYGIPTGFKSTAGGYQYFPYGISFDTDETKMAGMQVFVSGNPGNGQIAIRDLTVSGCLVLEAGMATGGGWFIPETSSARGLVYAGGKATFGFVAKQDDNKGSTGQLEFQYHADALELKSSSYDWVTVSATQAMFEGVGALNGQPGYRFRVRAVDGDKLGTAIDRFEIRIWINDDTFEMPTYRAEGDLAGGQIVVHRK